jgi:2-methylisocitrate lyase-like PEP mutase family enzyme
MAGKEIIPGEAMEAKLRAAAAARDRADTFLFARTDARAIHGLDEALRRAERYLKAGADGVFIEAPESVEELARIGREFRHVPQIANMLEGGGRTPRLSPAELGAMGFAVIAYPTTLIYRLVHDLRVALADLKAGRPMPADRATDFEGFKQLVGFGAWGALQDRFRG